MDSKRHIDTLLYGDYGMEEPPPATRVTIRCRTNFDDTAVVSRIAPIRMPDEPYRGTWCYRWVAHAINDSRCILYPEEYWEEQEDADAT